MLSTILFDLGDTLLDFRPLDTRAIVREGARDSYDYLRRAGVKLPPLTRYRRGHVRAVKLRLIWSRLRGREFNVLTMMRRRIARLGVPDTDEFMLTVGWEWYKPVVGYSTIEPNLIATLQLFREAGLKMGIVSNTFIGGPLLDRHMEEMGLLEFFPVRIYSSNTGYSKPDPRIFRDALMAIGSTPDQTLFVGDVVKNDIVGAARLGMKTALKRRGPMTSKYVMSGRFATPNYIISQIADLVPIVLPAEVAGSPR